MRVNAAISYKGRNFGVRKIDKPISGSSDGLRDASLALLRNGAAVGAVFLDGILFMGGVVDERKRRSERAVVKSRTQSGFSGPDKSRSHGDGGLGPNSKSHP